MRAEFQPVSDEELACQVQAGCTSSFEELVHRYETRIYRFVANSCRNQHDAQEVTQEAFVSAYLNIRQFDVARSFAAWLFTIARRKCIDRHRSTRPALEEALPEMADEDDPSVLLAQREAEQDLWQLARRALPELHFQALWLRYAEEMTVREIARVLRKTQTHVKVILFRARTTLGRALEEAGAQPGTDRSSAEPTPILSQERIPRNNSRVEPLNQRAVSGSAGTLAGETFHGQHAGKGAGAPGFMGRRFGWRAEASSPPGRG